MKRLFILSLLITIISCKNESTAPKPAETKEILATKGQKEIEKLVKDMYHWVENTPDSNGFRPFVKDSLVVGYDPIGQSLYTKSLRDSGYFSQGFLDNINSIYRTQDKLLRSGKVEWYDNEMSPFHGDANQWCNCQDGALSDITLHFEKVEANTAAFYWNWEVYDDPSWANHHYHIRTVKENGKWKIDYMEGWDYKANTSY